MEKLTAGESFRLTLKRNNIKQKNIVEAKQIDKRTVSRTLKKFDANKGNISKLIEYANSVGFDVEFTFIKQKKES